jgi:hypothetical protein
MSTHADPQSIPVIPSDVIKLLALFDAALDVGPYSVTLFGSTHPGAADALRAWAAARGFSVEETTAVNETGGYTNLTVRTKLIGGMSLQVLHARALTTAEIVAYLDSQRRPAVAS